MHPYRERPTSEAPPKPCSEDLVLYGLLVVIGAIPVAVAVLQRASFGIDATLGGLMVGAGVIGTVAHARAVLRRTPDHRSD